MLVDKDAYPSGGNGECTWDEHSIMPAAVFFGTGHAGGGLLYQRLNSSYSVNWRGYDTDDEEHTFKATATVTNITDETITVKVTNQEIPGLEIK